ncbi:substrate-binding periplasmic protein [Bdellovibrio sp. HCB290]|uniref:substrate-binding periplasmic protein n=1 Tax=Bdellovibrio sp. HCB290 TaxID=3394356 RepID=UPI0039B3A71C
MKSFLILLIVGFGFSWALAVTPKTITFVGYDYPPFFYRDARLGFTGASVDLMKELCKVEDLKCTFKILPIREALELIKEGKIAVGGPFAFTSHRQLKFYYSPPLFKATFGFFGAKKVVARIKDYDDLRGLKVTVTSPSYTSISLDKINDSVGGKIRIITDEQVLASIKKVAQGKFPLVYINRDVGRAWIKMNNASLVEVPSLGDESDYHFIFSRKEFSDDEFEKVNNRLMELLKNKTVQRIALKYDLIDVK